MQPTRVIIMGAAGREFHNFNVHFRDNPQYEVVCFTATQIPNIEGRTYPPRLAGSRYPQGIPILPEAELPRLVRDGSVQQVVFAYSDVPHQYVMNRASMIMAQGADFRIMGPQSTMLRSNVPVVAVTAARTGAGKSQTARRIAAVLTEAGRRVVVIRHPMPYGRLEEQIVQRFGDYADLDRFECTIEEREEYEPHIDQGNVVFAGVDYGEILVQAEQEADVIIWDGGNNDLPFYVPDFCIVLVDPHRAGHELTYHPGETNLRMADVVLVNKLDTADPNQVRLTMENVRAANPHAIVMEADSPVTVADPEAIRGKRVVVVEDGPTLTHGGMPYGAGLIAARRFGAAEIVDPRPYAVGSLVDVFQRYSQVAQVLPAMGYGEGQIRDLEATLNAVPADMVLIGTPTDLRRVVQLNKPAVRVRYELQERGPEVLKNVLAEKLAMGQPVGT